jgi:hypothetical protein
MIERNFHTDLQGVAMHRPNEAGYCRDDVYTSLRIGDSKRTFKPNAVSKIDYPHDSTEIFAD